MNIDLTNFSAPPGFVVESNPKIPKIYICHSINTEPRYIDDFAISELINKVEFNPRKSNFCTKNKQKKSTRDTKKKKN